MKLWRSIMGSHHPWGAAWTVSSRHGWLGGLSFCAAGWYQQARDSYIGWTHRERAAHLGRVVNNERFLILPGVCVPSLAAHALALSRLVDDWYAAYGVRPVLVYTYVDAAHAATGWDRFGERRSGAGRSG